MVVEVYVRQRTGSGSPRGRDLRTANSETRLVVVENEMVKWFMPTERLTFLLVPGEDTRITELCGIIT